MKTLLKNIAGLFTFLTVLFVHVYFALILLAKPALAEEMDTQDHTQTVAQENKEGGKKEVEVKLDTKKGLTIKGIGEAIDKLKEIEQTEGSIKKIKVTDDGISISAFAKGDGDEEEEESVLTMAGTESKLKVISNLLEDVLVPIVLFICVFGFVGYTVYAKNRTRREYLETIKVLAQSGQPIPPELMSGLASDSVSKSVPGGTAANVSALRGVKYIFWGVGIFGFMMLIEAGFVAGAFGFIFLMMGGYHFYTSQMMQKETQATPPPPAAN